MPNYAIACEWLNLSQLSEISRELDKIWYENDNMPILFTWTEWISSNLIEFLDLLDEPNTIIITPLVITYHMLAR